MELLLIGRRLWSSFSAGASLTPRTAAAGAVLTPTGAAARAAHTAGAALARRWPHLVQLLQLLGREDLFELRLYIGFQRRHLLLLIGGQVQVLLCPRGQQVKPALSLPRAAFCADFRRRRTVTGRRRAPLFLSA